MTYKYGNLSVFGNDFVHLFVLLMHTPYSLYAYIPVQKTGGTQLKLLMSFPNYGQALLKPMK